MVVAKKKNHKVELWKSDPDEHDFPAAADYLSLLFAPDAAALIVAELRKIEQVDRKAKDLLRSSRLPLLPSVDPQVASDLRAVARGERLSPVLLVRGRGETGVPVIIADGYHRVCASYHLNEDSDIPCRVAELP
jgi:hypothetical protein